MKYTRLFRLPWRRDQQIREDIDAELAFHLDLRAQELAARGVDHHEAERLARHRFGDLQFTREYCRDVDMHGERQQRRREWVTDLWQDLRMTARSLSKSPLFAVVFVLTLALAIGSTTAMMSFVNGVVLKPLPFTDPDRIVRVLGLEGSGGNPPLSYLDLRDLRAQSRTVINLSSMTSRASTLGGREGDPEQVNDVNVAGSFFELLGVRPLHGMLIPPRLEVDPQVTDVVLSEKLWRRRFGGDSSIIGKTITLNGVSRVVIGVVPQVQTFPSDADLWSPMSLDRVFVNPPLRRARFLRVYGTLASGATFSAAQTELASITKRLASEYPASNTGLSAEIRTLPSYLVGDARKQLFVLLGAVACLLLIACANLANLMLVRASAREGEMAVRTALGAGRRRLFRQSLLESTTLSVTGAVLGVLLAKWCVLELSALAHDRLPRLGEVALDARVLLATLGITVLTSVLFGLIPVWHHSFGALSQTLREGGRSVATMTARRTRNVLVVVEVALSLVLLTGAGLMIESFAKLRAVDPGFRSEKLITFGLSLRNVQEADPIGKRRQFTDQLLERLRATPGVADASITSHLPMTGASMVLNMRIEGQTERPGGNTSELRAVSPTYFSTMGIRVARGRSFDGNDGENAPHVVLVNEAGARQYFPGVNAIGQHVFFEAGSAVGGEIVGVIANVRHFSLDAEAVPEFYVPAAQTPPADLAVVVQTNAAPANAIRLVSRVVHELDPTLAVVHPRPLVELVSESVSRQRLHVIVLTFFAASALVLAALGIYGVVGYAVSRRSREIGIRIALGADAWRVKTLVVRQGTGLIAAGIAIGAGGAMATSTLLRGFLYAVEPSDPAALIGGAILLAMIGLVACYLPARQAAAVDPLAAIRSD